MPRKSLTGESKSKYAKFRVDSEVQTILKDLKRQGVNISEFIRNQIKCITSNKTDTRLVMKFCKLFKESTVFIPEESRNAFTDDLTEYEEQRIREILIGGNTP